VSVARFALRSILPLCLCLGWGLWILWPSLDAGLISDDFIFQAMMDGAFAVPRHPLDLFNFAAGTAAESAALREHGYPFWMAEEMRIIMLRPLASALIWLDRIALGDRFWLHHVHSLMWWCLLVVLCHRFYLRSFGAAVGALALLFFITDASHHSPVIWLANRGGLASVTLGVGALLAHRSWQEGGGRRYGWLSALLFGVALLFGEWVFSILGYVLSHQLLLAPGRLRQSLRARALGLLPAVVPALLFIAARRILGAGVRGSGVYIDPVAEPLQFLQQLGTRLPVFFADLFADVPAGWWAHLPPWRDTILGLELIPPRLWQLMPQWRLWHMGLGVLGLFATLGLLRASWSSIETQRRKEVWACLLGALLSLIPVAGSFPSRRLVLVAMLGVAPALALVVRGLLLALYRTAPARPGRFTFSYLLLLGLCLLHLGSSDRQDMLGHTYWARGSQLWVKRAELDPTRVADQVVVMLNPIDFATSVYFPATWRDAHRPLPRAFYTLALAPHPLRLRRLDDRGFELTVLGSSWLGSDEELHFRSRDNPLMPGQRLEVSDFRAEVAAWIGGRPVTLRFEFRDSLDAPHYVFLRATPAGLQRFEMPKVGEHSILPRGSKPNFLGLEQGRHLRRVGPYPSFVGFDPVPDFIDFGGE